jgi:hypothetical protein
MFGDTNEAPSQKESYISKEEGERRELERRNECCRQAMAQKLQMFHVCRAREAAISILVSVVDCAEHLSLTKLKIHAILSDGSLVLQ